MLLLHSLELLFIRLLGKQNAVKKIYNLNRLQSTVVHSIIISTAHTNYMQ